MKRLLLSVLVMVACSAAQAADNPTFSTERLSAEVKTLSSDAFEGRGPATPGETKTVDYVVAQMKAAGPAARRRPQGRQAQLDPGRAAAAQPRSSARPR